MDNFKLKIDEIKVGEFEGHPCVTDQEVEEMPVSLRQWVKKNCKHALNADVWLLPVGDKV